MFAIVGLKEDAAAFREARLKTGLNLRQFAEKLGVDYERYRSYEYGRVNAPASVKEAALNYGVEATPVGLRTVRGTPMASVKVIGRVSAGEGSSENDLIEDELRVPASLAQLGGSGWLVQGDSMMPLLEPGDVALFREFPQPRRGYPFLVQSPDGEYRVKVIDYDRGGWILKSLNKFYKDEPLGHHRVLGYLIGWYRTRGARETLDSDPNGLKLDFFDML